MEYLASEVREETMNGSFRLCSACMYWDREQDQDERLKGKCRRFPPRAEWALTFDDDWCGEWQPFEEIQLSEDEERGLRSASAAQALLALPPEMRDRLLDEVLTEEEKESASPPDDFYERIQRYFAERRNEQAT